MNEKEALATRLTRDILKKTENAIENPPFKMFLQENYTLRDKLQKHYLKMTTEALKELAKKIVPQKESYVEALTLWANELNCVLSNDDDDGQRIDRLIEVGRNLSAWMIGELLNGLGYDIDVEDETPESVDLPYKTATIIPSTPEKPKPEKPKLYSVELETTEYPWDCISFGEYLASVNVFYKDVDSAHHGRLIEYRCRDKKTLETMIREWWGSGGEDWDNEMLASITEVPSDEYHV